MCVRYLLHEPGEALKAVAEALGVRLADIDPMGARYNLAPSQEAPVVASAKDAAGLRLMRWGFVPPGERRSPKPRRLTNARSETLAQLPAFRQAAAARRCLVPANGFYEFKDRGTWKEPHLFTLPDGAPFAFAGLWEPPREDEPASFCIVTTAPNALMTPIHHRMPVVLTRAAMARWIGDRPLPPEELADLTRPPPPDLLSFRKVNAYVNNSRHEGPRCIAPPDEAPPELF